MEASSIGIWEVDLVRGIIDWDQRCAAIFGLEGARTIPMRPAVRRARPPRRPGVRRRRRCRPRSTPAPSTRSSCATLHAAAAEWRWTVSRGRVLVDADGEPVRILGTVARRHRGAARRPSAGCPPSSAPRRSPRSPRSWPTRPGSSSWPTSRCAAPQVLGRRVRRAGGLRPRRRPAAAAHDHRLMDAVEIRDARRAARRRRRDRAGRHAAHAVRGPARRAGAARRPRRRPPPGSPRWPRCTRRARHRRASPRCRCAWRGGCSARSWPLWATAAPVRRRRRRGAGGADRADRAQRLPAAGRRPARGRGHRDDRGQPAAAAARRGRPGAVGHPGHRPSRSSSWPSWSCRSWATGAGCVVTDEQRPAARGGPRAPRPGPHRGARDATCAAWWRR